MFVARETVLEILLFVHYLMLFFSFMLMSTFCQSIVMRKCHFYYNNILYVYAYVDVGEYVCEWVHVHMLINTHTF